MSTRLKESKHVMVPDHIIMTEEEVSRLLGSYNITKEQLPKVYLDDPAVKTIGAHGAQVAQADDVIRIVRESHTAGRAESYRLVVKRPKK